MKASMILVHRLELDQETCYNFKSPNPKTSCNVLASSTTNTFVPANGTSELDDIFCQVFTVFQAAITLAPQELFDKETSRLNY